MRIKCEKSLYWSVTNVCVWLVKNIYLYICNNSEGNRVISVLGLLLSVLPTLNKAYCDYY